MLPFSSWSGTVGSPPNGVKTGTDDRGDFRQQVAEISQASAAGRLTVPLSRVWGDFRQVVAGMSHAGSLGRPLPSHGTWIRSSPSMLPFSSWSGTVGIPPRQRQEGNR
jgi:hypothetical protein